MMENEIITNPEQIEAVLSAIYERVDLGEISEYQAFKEAQHFLDEFTGFS